MTFRLTDLCCAVAKMLWVFLAHYYEIVRGFREVLRVLVVVRWLLNGPSQKGPPPSLLKPSPYHVARLAG